MLLTLTTSLSLSLSLSFYLSSIYILGTCPGLHDTSTARSHFHPLDLIRTICTLCAIFSGPSVIEHISHLVPLRMRTHRSRSFISHLHHFPPSPPSLPPSRPRTRSLFLFLFLFSRHVQIYPAYRACTRIPNVYNHYLSHPVPSQACRVVYTSTLSHVNAPVVIQQHQYRTSTELA